MKYSARNKSLIISSAVSDTTVTTAAAGKIDFLFVHNKRRVKMKNGRCIVKPTSLSLSRNNSLCRNQKQRGLKARLINTHTHTQHESAKRERERERMSCSEPCGLNDLNLCRRYPLNSSVLVDGARAPPLLFLLRRNCHSNYFQSYQHTYN